MILAELVDKATIQAKQGLDAQAIPARTELVANSLVSQVFQDVALILVADGRTSSIPKLSKDISFTDGLGTLSSDTLTQCKFDSILYDPTDSTKEYALVPEFADFMRVYDTRMGYYCIKEGTLILVVEPGDLYVEGEGLTATLSLVIPCVPPVPSSGSGVIAAPNEFTNASLNLLAERLRGVFTERAAI
jgi:hypothetical protein